MRNRCADHIDSHYQSQYYRQPSCSLSICSARLSEFSCFQPATTFFKFKMILYISREPVAFEPSARSDFLASFDFYLELYSLSQFGRVSAPTAVPRLRIELCQVVLSEPPLSGVYRQIAFCELGLRWLSRRRFSRWLRRRCGQNFAPGCTRHSFNLRDSQVSWDIEVDLLFLRVVGRSQH